MSAPSSPSVIVVGAGIVGAACAEALAEAGCQVEVLEAGLVGAGATGAAMGHVVVMDGSDAEFTLTARSRRLWTERASSLPQACEDTLSGSLWLAADEEEMDHVHQKGEYYESRGETVQLLDGPALRRLEPQLSTTLLGALRVPADRIVYPPAAAWLFLEKARARGATLREGTAVEAVEPGRARVAGTWHEADLVVVAAAAASARLLPGLPIEPRKGHLVITDRYPGFLGHQVIELGYLKEAHTMKPESVAFNIQPRATGQLLIGSSRELVGWDASLNRPLRDRMLGRAREYVPRVATLSALRTWVGFRPATPDGLPLIGTWEPGLLVAAGHEGLGVTTSLGTAETVADLALGRTGTLDPKAFDPRRPMDAHG